MPKSYSDLLKQIQTLRKEADELRRKEASEVIARIKEAIDHYELKPEDLFGSGKRRAARGTGAGGGRATKSSAGAPRFADGTGNVWGGRGPRPKWLRDALASGRQLSDFEVKSQSSGNGTARTRKAAAKAKRGSTIRYRDDAGHSWSGFGPKPRWLKEALAAGKKLDDLAV